MAPHSWIVECLGMVGMSKQIKHSLSESIKAWMVDLTCNNQSLGGVDINQGIFLGDSLSALLFALCLIPSIVILRKSEFAYKVLSNKEDKLLFMDDLKLHTKNEKGLVPFVQRVQIFTDNTGILFGINNCATLDLEKGKITEFDEILLPDGRVMKRLIDGAG